MTMKTTYNFLAQITSIKNNFILIKFRGKNIKKCSDSFSGNSSRLTGTKGFTPGGIRVQTVAVAL